MSHGPDTAAAGCAPAATRAPPASATAIPESSSACLTCRSHDRKTIDAPASAGGEVLVGAGGVLARPLVELLAGVAARAEHIQAQATARVLEFIGAVRLLNRKPQAVGAAVRDLLDDVGSACSGRAARHRHVVARVLSLELPVAAGGGNELELLVGLAVAGPLVDRRTGRGGVAEHVQAQVVAGDDKLVVATGEATTTGLRRRQIDCERVMRGLEGERHRDGAAGTAHVLVEDHLGGAER